MNSSDENVPGVSGPLPISGQPEKKEEQRQEQQQPKTESAQSTTQKEDVPRTDEPSQSTQQKVKRLSAPSGLRVVENKEDQIEIEWKGVAGAKDYTVEYADKRNFEAGRTITQRGVTGTSFSIKPMSKDLHHFCVYAVDKNNIAGEKTDPLLTVDPVTTSVETDTPQKNDTSKAKHPSDDERVQKSSHRGWPWSSIIAWVIISLLLSALIFGIYSSFVNENSETELVANDSEIITKTNASTTRSQATPQSSAPVQNIIYNINQIGGSNPMETIERAQSPFTARLNKPIDVRKLQEEYREIVTGEPAFIELPPNGTRVLVLQKGRRVSFDPSTRFRYYTDHPESDSHAKHLIVGSNGYITFKSLDPHQKIRIPLRFEELP